MTMLRPYPTLILGILLGIYVVPKITNKLNVNLPGA